MGDDIRGARARRADAARRLVAAFPWRLRACGAVRTSCGPVRTCWGANPCTEPTFARSQPLHGADPWVSCTARSQTPMGHLCTEPTPARSRPMGLVYCTEPKTHGLAPCTETKCMHLSRLGEISGRRSPAAPRAAGPRSPRARVAEVADGDEDRRAARARASGPRPPARSPDVKPRPRRPAPATPARRRLRAAATPPPDVRTTILVAAVVRARARPLAPSTRPRSRRRRPSRALTSGLSRATGRYGVPLARAGRGGAGVAKLGRKSGFEGQFWHFFVPSDAASSSWGALN